MKGYLSPDTYQDACMEKVPWNTFVFLTLVFFIAHHDIFYSLKVSEVSGTAVFGTTVDNFTTVVEKGNLLRQVVFLTLGLVATVSLLKNRLWRVKANGLLGWLLLFFLSWAFISFTWADNPQLTIKRLVLLATMVLGAFTISQRFSLRQAVLWVFFSTILYLHLGIAAEILLGTFYPFSWGYRFAGTLHPNNQSINCVLLLYASLFLTKDDRRWHRILAVVAFESLIFLFLTKCRASLLFAGLALFLYWMLSTSLLRKFFVVLCLLWVSCLVALFSDLIIPIINHAIKLGRGDVDTLTLTGRIPLWSQLLSYIANRPIQGYGYDGFWGPQHINEIAKVQEWAVTHAHSAYLDLTLGLGLVGGISYFFIVILGIGKAIAANRYSGDKYFGFVVVALIFAGFDGFLEPIVIMPTHTMFVNMVILSGLGFSIRDPVHGR